MGTTRVSYSHGAPSTSFYTEADYYDQNAAANTSRVRAYIRCVNDGNSSSFSNGSGAHNGYINGGLFRQHAATPFLPSGVGSGANRWYEGPYYITVTHDANGVGSYTVRQYVTDSVGTNDQTTGSIALPRIAQVPGAPGTPSISAITPDTATVAWTAAARGHADITDYYLEVSTDAGFGSLEFTASVGLALSKALTGLAKYSSHYARVRAANSDGTGSYSAVTSFTTPPGTPSAPVAITAAYSSDTQAIVGWAHNSPADSFPTSSKVQRSVNGGAYTDYAPISVATSYPAAVAANQKSVFKVLETNATGSSPWSAISPAVYTTPAAPSGVTATKDASLNIVIGFTSNVAFSEYQHTIEHGTALAGVTTWDGAPLTTLGSGVFGYTHVTPDPSKAHVYRIYAQNTGTGTLSSTKTTSNTVQLLVAPNKPTFPVFPLFLDKAKTWSPTWTHNSVDTTPQKAYEFGYSTNGGAAWSTTGKVVSAVLSKAFAASAYAANTALTVRVRTWGEATTGGSDGTGASPWSDVATVTFKTRPVVTITSPANGGTYTQADLIVALGFSQAESATFVRATIKVYDSVPTLLETLVSTTRASTLMGTSVDNGSSYSVTVTVVDSNGLTSDLVTSAFSVVYTLPVAAAVVATYLPDSGRVQLDLTIAVPTGGEVAAELVTITRTIEGKTEYVDVGRAVAPTMTILDTTPTIHGTNSYAVATTSGDGATAVTLVALVTDECRRAFLSKGPGFSSTVVFGANLSVSEALSVASDAVEAAGRTKPVGMYGTETSVSISVSSFVFETFGSSLSQIRDLLVMPGQACYRDSSGRRVFGAVKGSISYKKADRGILSFALTETA